MSCESYSDLGRIAAHRALFRASTGTGTFPRVDVQHQTHADGIDQNLVRATSSPAARGAWADALTLWTEHG